MAFKMLNIGFIAALCSGCGGEVETEPSIADSVLSFEHEYEHSDDPADILAQLKEICPGSIWLSGERIQIHVILQADQCVSAGFVLIEVSRTELVASYEFPVEPGCENQLVAQARLRENNAPWADCV